MAINIKWQYMPPDKNNKEDKPQMFPRITESEICLDRNGVVANICLSKRRTDTDGIFVDGQLQDFAQSIWYNGFKLGIMELSRIYRPAS